MKRYFAPMEGLTGYIYRNAFEQYYGRGRIDKYFIPFISPNKTNGYTTREREDIDPLHNAGLYAVPQIMANNSAYFIGAANMLYALGYREINLNLGCPSGTVVSKFRGAGFLARPDELDLFLEEVFSNPVMQQMALSLKTRLGMTSASEFDALLEIYNRYPVKELIIHPRVRSDYYKNMPDWDAFEHALHKSTHPVCYNGDLFTGRDYERFIERFPQVEAVMLGRGLVADPGLLSVLTDGGRTDARDLKAERMQLKAFHDSVFAGYLSVMSGELNAIHKMKEIWSYMKNRFTGGERAFKRIKKAQCRCEYEAAVHEFFENAVKME